MIEDNQIFEVEIWKSEQDRKGLIFMQKTIQTTMKESEEYENELYGSNY